MSRLVLESWVCGRGFADPVFLVSMCRNLVCEVWRSAAVFCDRSVSGSVAAEPIHLGASEILTGAVPPN